MRAYEHPVFGPERRNAARAALQDLDGAECAYEAGGGPFGSPRLWDRLIEARRIREMYAEYHNSVLRGGF